MDTVPRSSHTETPIPTRSVATKNVSIVNFTTPRMRYYGNDPEDSLENELLLSIEPVSDPAPIPDEPVPACESTPARVTTPVPKATSISKSVVDGSLTDSDASHKPVTEPPVPPGLSQQENNAYSDFIVPKRAKSRFKSLFFIPICLGILLGSIVMYRYWQNHNYQPESWVSNTAGYEKKSTKSYSYKIPEEEGKTQNVIHPASQRTRAKQLAYLNSLAEFARVVTDLDHGIEKGMALSEFITKAIHLSKAYHKIKVSPEIQRILDFDLSRRAKQYTPGAEEMAPILSVNLEIPERSGLGGDETGYLLYRQAQDIRKQAHTLAQIWDTPVMISSQRTIAANESSIEPEASGDRVLQRLRESTETFMTMYKEYVARSESEPIP